MKKLIVGITSSQSITLLRGQLKYFSQNDYQVYLMSPRNDSVDSFCQEEGCVLLPVNSIKRDVAFFSDIITLLQICKYFIQIRPDIVNVGTPKMGLLGSIAAWITGVKKRIFTCRGFVFEKKEGRYTPNTLKLMDKLPGIFVKKIVCISPSVKEIGVREKLFRETKCIVIGKGSSNGFDLLRFRPQNISQNEITELKKEFSLQNNFVFGFIGRFADEKGIKELYEAFLSLYDKNDKVRLLMVGRIEKENIKYVTILKKIEEHPGIILAGEQKNIPLYLSLMDVFILPAWSEGFGNVLVEAAAMGVPVISTMVTGCKDAVNDGFNGILIEPKNTKKLHEKMLLLYEDDELRKKFGINGLEWAKNFQHEIIWQGLKQLYEEM
jgi:glycosyltransferase involved in cell wall biosynthesis